MGVSVMGVGFTGAVPTSDGLSYRELIARAARMAYQDAGIEPEQLDGAVSVEEDFVSGYSIADEYVPDQLGVVRKPVYTICGDFLRAIRQFQVNPDLPLELEDYVAEEHLAGTLGTAVALGDPATREQVLREVALLGVDLLGEEVAS